MTRQVESQCLRTWEAFASLPRLRLLRLLSNGELCVRDFHELLGWPQSTTSRHLLYLEKRGLVRCRKDGLWRYYALRSSKDPMLRLLLAAAEKGLAGLPVFESDRRKRASLRVRLRALTHKKYSRSPATRAG